MEKIHMITYGNNIYSRAKERIKRRHYIQHGLKV